MKSSHSYRKPVWLLVVLIAIIVVIAVLVTKFSGSNNVYAAVSTSSAQSCDCKSPTSPYIVKINFNNAVPGDLLSFNNQAMADCFAWQEFITLNWPVNESAGFGSPGDTNPVQWETYMPREVLFPDGGTAPPAWGTLVSDEYKSLFKSQNLLMDRKHTKLLTFISKKADNGDQQVNFTPNQAAPSNKPSWLGAQNSTNVWYEILLNKDYYDYIVANGFYNAATQHESVSNGNPINFPMGQYNGAVGAIELKASWMEVTDASSPKWKRYKLSSAVVLDPATHTLRNTTVALVGLHILHKTQNQPTWVWATFEQVDNVPGSSTPPSGYNFYSDDCQPRQVTIQTATGKDSVVTVSATPNTPPPFYLGQAAPVPIQAKRVNAIDPVDAVPINTLMQNSIKQYYPESVWQYYQLVDVIWSQQPQKNLTQPVFVPRPLNTASMVSGAHVVANATMETYVQNTTCYNCHMYSTIAPYPPNSVNDTIFSDFSFAITFAKYSGAAPNLK
ncbi:hypothetical protein [Flavobacterium rhizosphaerae]|uniref:Cytochrome c family protein n=1 Tax=Flavobacterium rhizosphaerae TaxID=3163298 RepID=A0ABW8YW74_9FLAO